MAATNNVYEFPNLPFSAPIAGGANDGSELVVSGTVYSGTQNGFVIEYVSTEGVAFHFNVRLGYVPGTERVIVLNNNRCGRWEREERHANNIVLNQYVNISIKSYYDRYVVSINGAYLCAFSHRESPMNVKSVSVHGDIRADSIRLLNFVASKPTYVVSQPQPTVVLAQPVVQPATVYVPPPRPAPTVVIAAAPRPPPAIIIAPRARPAVEVIVPGRRRPGFGVRLG